MNKVFVATVLVFVCGSSNALEVATGHVTLVEPTYLHGAILFMMDSGSPSCPAGVFLKWAKSDLSNNKAVFATLMLALATDRKVNFHVNDGDTTCTGQYLHLLSN